MAPYSGTGDALKMQACHGISPDGVSVWSGGGEVVAAFRSAIQSIGRWRVTGFQAPVYLPGAWTAHVSVSPGDFILADEDGAIVIPNSIVEDALTKAEEMTAREVAVREAIGNGLSLADALKQFGHV
ncbi:RraA family protein [Mycolicibacterium sp. F2034L]|uniref:RraA family protein n=1 Tax=Mycolicibacterium sp. F2034L TaxID=2926422 RepID=UPI001FF0FFC6|nr:RraA family protein [Mycolicibacterium sp. F2034L]MCK0177509.1 RraA family protein [Mycolicibacterium sp. F2034L]